MRVPLGPVTKAAEEKFWLEMPIYRTIPTGETITSFNVQALRRGSSPVAYTTDAIFGVTPETEINTTIPMVRARMVADATLATVGEHLVEFEIITDAGTKFEGEIFLNIVERLESNLDVGKKEQERFPVGYDFSKALEDAEAVSSGTVEAAEKYQGGDTTLDLFFSGTAQVSTGLVTGELRPAVSIGAQEGEHEIKVTANTSTGNILMEWISMVVEQSQPTEPP